MTVRRATAHDATDMESLLLAEAPHITLSTDGAGAEPVFASMRADALARNMESGRFCYWVFTEPTDHALRGLIGLREGTHLYQLFVRSGWHRQGIGRTLWLYMLSDWPSQWSRPEHITVNASPYGLPAYKALGFVPTGPRAETNGIAFVPMRCVLNHH